LDFQLISEIVNGIVQYNNVEKKHLCQLNWPLCLCASPISVFFQSISTMKVQEIDAPLL